MEVDYSCNFILRFSIVGGLILSGLHQKLKGHSVMLEEISSFLTITLALVLRQLLLNCLRKF